MARRPVAHVSSLPLARAGLVLLLPFLLLARAAQALAPLATTDSSITVKETKRNGQVISVEMTWEVTVANHLDCAVNQIAFDLRFSGDGPPFLVYGSSENTPLVFGSPVRVHGNDRIEPHGSTRFHIPVPASTRGTTANTSFSSAIASYLVEKPSGALLVQLVDGGGAADMTAAAASINDVRAVPLNDRPQLARELSDFLNQARSRPGGLNEGMGPLFALHALISLGNAEYVPLLLEVQALDGARWSRQLANLHSLQTQWPDHPLGRIFPSNADLAAVVAQELRALPEHGAAAGLVAARYGANQAAVRKLAAAQLDALCPAWSDRVAALKGPAAAPALEALCRTGDPSGVHLLLSLAAAGHDEGRARACVSALPASVAIPGLTAALEEALGPAEPTAVELLLARGDAGRAALAGLGKRLGVPASADARALADAVTKALHEQRRARVDAALAAVDKRGATQGPADREPTLAAISAQLMEAEMAANGAAERARLASGYIRLAEQALGDDAAPPMFASLRRTSVLLAPKPVDGTADAALLSFARRVGQAMPPPQATRVLRQIEPWVFAPARKAELAEPWMALSARATDSSERESYEKQARALNHKPDLAAITRLGMGAIFALLLVVLVVTGGIRGARKLRSNEKEAIAELGPVLLRKRISVVSAALYSVAILFCLFVGVGAGLAGFSVSWYLGPLLLAVPSALSLYMLNRAAYVFRVHELGVSGISLFGKRKLRHEDISRFSYGGVRHHRYGMYVGTELFIRFAPTVGNGISYREYVSGNNERELDALRDRISRQIAERLLAHMNAGQQVPWGPALFTRQALVLRGSAIPYSAGLSPRIERGVLTLFLAGGRQPVMTMACAEDNFYPGLMILGALVGAAEQRSGASGTS